MKDHVTYEEKKNAIRMAKARERDIQPDFDEFDPDLYDSPDRTMRLTDVTQVGSKVLIGGGLGVLAGVATIGQKTLFSHFNIFSNFQFKNYRFSLRFPCFCVK